jgi:hypothetical protein
MTRARFAPLALCLAAAVPVHAAPEAPSFAPAPPSAAPRLVEGEGRAGDLHIIQLWTNDSGAFLAEWARPTPPNLATSSRTTRNRPLSQFIIFDSCRADAAGNCHLTARIAITDPDGAPYGDPMAFAIWDQQPAPPPKRLILSPHSIGLVIEDGEKLGTYRVHLSVTDEHAGVTAESTSAITVDEAGSEDAATAATAE